MTPRRARLPGMPTLAVRPSYGSAGRAQTFQAAVQQHAPGQSVMTYDEPMRFRGRETDPRNADFNTEPSAHVEGHGFIRDNTATTKAAYRLRDDDTWGGAQTRTLQPDHPLHTLQTERETATPSSRPAGVGPLKPRVMRIRGKDVLVDGHHRVARDRAAGRPSQVDHVDMDADAGYGMKLHQLRGV